MSLFSSSRARRLNPLVWPFTVATLAYGLGFAVFKGSVGVGMSSLFLAMNAISPSLPLVWGLGALVAVALAVVSLSMNFRSGPKLAGLLGFMVWVFAAFCWYLTGGLLLVFAVALPNAWFWSWVLLQNRRA